MAIIDTGNDTNPTIHQGMVTAARLPIVLRFSSPFRS